MDRLRQLMENLLYPELRAYGRKDRARLLREASKEPLDFLEWVGILAALVLVVSFTRYGVAGFRGFRQFLLRGVEKVRAEWAMICTPHNLLKLPRAA